MRRTYLAVIYFTNIIFMTYISSILGFRLLSKDFLPNMILLDNCIPNALFHSMLTSTGLLIAGLFYPLDHRPKIDSGELQVHFEAGNDQIALFSGIDQIFVHFIIFRRLCTALGYCSPGLTSPDKSLTIGIISYKKGPATVTVLQVAVRQSVT